jgi:putative DNA primase/helicase
MPDDVISRLTALGMDEGEDHPGPPMSEVPEPEITVSEGIVPLGHDRGVFYYLSRSARQVFAISADRHSRNMLMAMASVPYYWQRTRFVNDKNQIQWDQAIDDMMRQCRDIGIFDPDRIRGRGAWLDDGRAVLHLGNKLIVDGRQQSSLILAESRFVYEAGRSLSHVAGEALANREAHKVVEICQALRWERPISGMLLAGFIVVAPVCGALAWRPSTWLTGSSGSGKSTVQESIVAPLIGGMALRVQSKTSEAGIRQALGSDARPVLFDEAEGEDAHAAARMQAVLDLVRQSSSESGADIVKGSQTHSAKRFRIRSSFFFSSINVGIEHRADESRVTVLALRPNRAQTAEERAVGAKQFDALKRLIAETITPEFCAGLLARTVKLLPIIRENAETFADAVARKLGDRRLGDQLGALLAGAYSLHASRTITADEASRFIDEQDWSIAAEPEIEQDEYRLLSQLTQFRVRIAPGNGAGIEATVGRLIQAAAGKDQTIVAEVAASELSAIGFRYGPLKLARENGQDVVLQGQDGAPIAGVYVSNTHPALKRLLVGTPWSAGWSRSLSRIPGAAAAASAVRFGPGHQARAVWVPMTVVIPPEENHERDERQAEIWETGG